MAENAIDLSLDLFLSDDALPLFIQYGRHAEELFLHTHKDFSELVTVMEGSAVHIVNGEEYVIKKGDIFVVGTDTPHGYKDTDDLRICNIMYRSEIFSAAPDITRSAGFHALFVLEPHITREHTFKSRLKLDREQYERVNMLTDSMLTEYSAGGECSRTMLLSLFMQLASSLSRWYSFDDGISRRDIINIARAASYMEKHFAEDISVAELAEHSHYSPRHFIREFSRTYGASPLEYLIDLRLSHACAMLKNTKLTVSQIASLCGVGDCNYFSRIFRRRKGCSPTEYRKKA